MVLKMVVAGVIGYPAKKLHPAANAPLAIASFPSRKNRVMTTLPGEKEILITILIMDIGHFLLVYFRGDPTNPDGKNLCEAIPI